MGRAVRTVDYYLAILRQILEFAYKNKFIKDKPYEGVKRLQNSKPKPAPLLKHEFQQLIASSPAKQKNMWQLAVYTGIRLAELCALAWEDIDLNKGEIHISRNLIQHGSFGPPKTNAGYRTIKLLEPALNALIAQKKLPVVPPIRPLLSSTGSMERPKYRIFILLSCRVWKQVYKPPITQ